MSVQNSSSTDEPAAQIALLEELIEEVDERLAETSSPPTDEAATPEEKAETSAYVAVEELLEEKKARLEAQQNTQWGTTVDEETSIPVENLSRYVLFASDHRHYWCPKWDAVIQYGGHSTATGPGTGVTGAEYVTEITFAVTDLAKRDGMDVYRDTRARLMDARSLPATEAVAFVDDHCVPLGRHSATGEAADPRSRHHGVEKYRLLET